MTRQTGRHTDQIFEIEVPTMTGTSTIGHSEESDIFPGILGEMGWPLHYSSLGGGGGGRAESCFEHVV